MTNVIPVKNLPVIAGFNKSSEAGPDVFAFSVFLYGCNLRCPYCMNTSLVLPDVSTRHVDITEVIKYIDTEHVKMVMISGGEPTMTDSNKLVALSELFHAHGCRVGMSTNGTRPSIFKHAIHHLDYVALDIKSSQWSDYEQMGALQDGDAFTNVLNTKSMLVEEKMNRPDFDYEVRTTLYPTYINAQRVRRIGGWMRPDEKWVFQEFRHAKKMLSAYASQVVPYTSSQVEEIMGEARKYTSKVSLRYV